jgi:acetylornithine/LysW-gamma-L-lysine aminotransferase
MDEGQLDSEDELLLPLYHKLPIIATKGSGVYLYGADGRRYLDFMAAYGVALLGHCHPAVVQAITEQARRLISAHGSVYSEARSHFVKALSRVAPEGLSSYYLCNSGAEAIEAALKFARKATGRTGFIAFTGSYHGKTFGALSVTSSERYREPFEPLLGPVTFGRYDDVESLEGLPWGDSAAVLVEPIQGEAGVRIPSEPFMKTLETKSKENGCLLVVDEIQSGLGRTGKMWAHQHFDLRPDIMTVAKGLAGGVPFGVTLVSKEVAQHVTLGDHSTTFGGNPLACAAASVVLTVLTEQNLPRRAELMGELLAEGLQRLSSFHIIRESRTKGLMAALELRVRFNRVLEECIHNGLLTLYSGRNIIRMLPPLIINERHLESALSSLRAAINVVEKEAVAS